MSNITQIANELATKAHNASWPWYQRLSSWKPFQLDALGLVTLLGHEEVNESLGRLVPSRWLEYLPMLGAFVVAGDRFKDKKPSFNLYNIDQGIHTTELSCWLTRWMVAQDFEKTCSIVQFEVSETPRSSWRWKVVAFLISLAFTGLLLAMTLLADDKYGKVNAVAMIVAIMVRTYLLEANRAAIDSVIEEAQKKNGRARVQYKKCMVILSDSRAVTLFLPGHLIISIFTMNPEPAYSVVYHGVRWIGWAAFAVHVLTIGNAFLAIQIYCVGLIVIPTVLAHWKFGCDDSKWLIKWNKFWGTKVVEPYECWIGSRLKATCFEWPLNVEFIPDTGGQQYTKAMHDGKLAPTKNQKWHRLPEGEVLRATSRSTKRQDLYAWLNLTVDEELSMGKWDLFPHQREGNTEWWANYNEKKALIARDPPRIEDMKRRKHVTMISKRTTTEDFITERETTKLTCDVEKGADTEHEEPELGRPREAMKTVAGADGLVRKQTGDKP